MKPRRKLEPGMRVEWENMSGLRYTGTVKHQWYECVTINGGIEIHRRQVTKVFVKKKRPKLGREFFIREFTEAQPHWLKFSHPFTTLNGAEDPIEYEPGKAPAFKVIRVREVLDDET